MHLEPRSSGSPARSQALAACGVIERVYLEHSPLLRRVAVRKFGIPPGDADTLVHDVFAAYIANPGAVRSDLRAYLIAAICNASRNYWRTKEMQERFFVAGGDERELPLRRGRQSILEFANRIATEDSDAHQLLDGILDSGYRFARENIASKKRFRTGGVVRLLCEAMREECKREPRYAMELAHAAKIIAESLADDYYPSRLVFDLRGRAWKEVAVACHHLGHHHAGLTALAHAECAYSHLPDSGPGMAAVNLAKALLYWKLQRYSDGVEFARASAHEYESRHDILRFVQAREMEAVLLHRTGDLLGARAIFQHAFEAADALGDLDMKARAAGNLGVSYRETSDFGPANSYSLIALGLYDNLNQRALAARTRWCLGRLSLAEGKYKEAEVRLLAAIDLLEDCGLSTDAAEALLDLERTLIFLGRVDEASSLHAWLDGHHLRGAQFEQNSQLISFAITRYLRECYRARTVARTSELAERLNANRTTLSRTITEALGRTLVSEMRGRQLEESLRLLCTTNLPIAEVASRSAFGDRATFFRVFRTAFELTPGEYRKRAQERQQNTTLRHRSPSLSS